MASTWLRPSSIAKERMKQLRTKRGLSMVELAAALSSEDRSYSRQMLHDMERPDGREITIDELVALAVALDVSPQLLLTPIDEVSGVDVDVRGDRQTSGAHLVSFVLFGEWFAGRERLPIQDPDLYEVSNRPLAMKEYERLNSFAARIHQRFQEWFDAQENLDPSAQGWFRAILRDLVVKPPGSPGVPATEYGRVEDRSA